jgi:SAM-dependent methyltransferase
LAKPAYSPHETPDLLTSFGALLSGLELYSRLTVLDFGVGSGWTSWLLSQMGCRVIASDISATALRITAERYARFPLIGAVPQPQLLRFDGRRFELDDGSVDRIACNDAFHHVGNPEEVLVEFHRVLRPGGVCVMSEPGPHHSRLPQAQAEMRNFRVVERDILVEEIESQARAAGFETIEVAVFCGMPRFVDVGAFQAQIDPDSPFPNEIVRTFLENRRLLRLRAAGTVALDSRWRNALAGSLHVELVGHEIRAIAVNTSSAVWLEGWTDVGSVNLGAHLFTPDGRLLDFEFLRLPLRAGGEPILPGERVEVYGPLPDLRPGAYRVEFDLVAEDVAWFVELGNQTVTINISA